MIEKGFSKRKIKDTIRISGPYLKELLNEMNLETNASKDENDIENSSKIEPVAEQISDLVPPPSNDQEIIDKAADSAKQSISTWPRGEIYKDYVTNMKTASYLKSAEARFRKSIEDAGYNWETFVNFAIEYTYEKVMRGLEIRRQLKEEWGIDIMADEGTDALEQKIKEALMGVMDSALSKINENKNRNSGMDLDTIFAYMMKIQMMKALLKMF